MNSAAYLVSGDGRRLVLKAVDADDTAFEPRLALAVRLDDAGVTTGRPTASKHGRLVERVDGRQVAVLEYVDGPELDETDQAEIGELLGRVHAAAAVEPGDTADWLRFMLPFEESLDLEPWIRPAVEGAVTEVI